MPVSEEGDIAHVASACERACCNAVCMVSRRDRWEGRGVAEAFDFTLLRVIVAGGVGGL